ncbi:SOS response-associated peptidase family protein [Bradyrhizobium pachyrhizi]|uniref:SOS response-associated peptidase family protein n=1 Tax=Bradyrhizobium pachyrhizi TaxID=280333 RepID=UPI00040941CB
MLANRHCIIPAEYIYEWREEDGEKQPCLFARQDGKPLMQAAHARRNWDWSEVKGERSSVVCHPY